MQDMHVLFTASGRQTRHPICNEMGKLFTMRETDKTDTTFFLCKGRLQKHAVGISEKQTIHSVNNKNVVF